MVVDDRTRLIAGSGFLTFFSFINQYVMIVVVVLTTAEARPARFDAKQVAWSGLSLIRDPIVRPTLGSNCKRLIFLARKLPQFARFGPLICP